MAKWQPLAATRARPRGSRSCGVKGWSVEEQHEGTDGVGEPAADHERQRHD